MTHGFYRKLKDTYNVFALEQLPPGALFKAYRDVYESPQISNIQECALIMVDQQRQYCDPAYGQFGNIKTRAVSHRNKDVSAALQNCGLDIYVVYAEEKKYQGHEHAGGGLYLYDLKPQDCLIYKRGTSAFNNSYPDIHDTLQGDKKKTLFLKGFNAGSCLFSTAEHAHEAGYEVYVLGDCIAQDKRNRDESKPRLETKTDPILEMNEKGIKITSSAMVIEAFQNAYQWAHTAKNTLSLECVT